MQGRSEALIELVEAAASAFAEFARGKESERTVREVFTAFSTTTSPKGRAEGGRLPACSHLDQVLGVALPTESLNRLVDAFRQLEPSLAWKRRASNATASENFDDGHANAMILGPGGHEDRTDAWLGVTLMAPGVRYPDHDHSPEEVYLVLSDGEFKRRDSAWFVPGIGGSFYNEPEIRHAMRSTTSPLLAFWVLRAGEPSSS